MKIQAVKCPICKDVIFSRSRHDFHYCTCGDTMIDGGFDYLRYGGTDLSKIEQVELDLPVTKEELYQDWNRDKNKYGIISEAQT